MTNFQFKALARRYSFDSHVLLKAGRWSSSYYLAGYAVECALKACVAKMVQPGRIPERRWVNDSYTHDLVRLVNLAGLSSSLQSRKAGSPAFRRNWDDVVVKWTTGVRYAGVPPIVAEEMVKAVNDEHDGVLQWLRGLW
jgi:hypothetical protein